MIILLKNLINNLGYVILIAFIVSKLSTFRRIIQKDKFKRFELVILSLIFGGFGILGTYIGVEFNGAIANTRIIGVMTGGILCGPFVGIVSGIIAGVHRLFIGSGNITAIPCTITTIMSGIISGIIYKKTTFKNKWIYGLVGGILMESIEMIFILIMAKPFSVALGIVMNIYIPMGITNAIGIALLILLIENIFEEKEEIAAKQAQIALEIANKTLPYFREINGDSFEKICEIIKNSTKADAVSITDKEYIIAHVGLGSDHHLKGEKILTKATEQVVKNGNMLELSDSKQIACPHVGCPLKSAFIVPLKDEDEIIGTLKIYYAKENADYFTNKSLAIGLSQIISTQLELSKVQELKEMANKAEIKALQAQINPHFLFNALNAIVSFVRIDPDKARELILNLSTYMRYNLEIGENRVDIYKELEQVKAYVEIEKARFGEKLNVIYNVEEDLDIKIPSLIIQPIVENSIKHGILKGTGKGTVKVDIKRVDKNQVKVTIQDDGIGIPKEIIQEVYEGRSKENKIGISNVHNRLKNIYGAGLNIERLINGTRSSFVVHRLRGDSN